jgi:hypothetical protein
MDCSQSHQNTPINDPSAYVGEEARHGLDEIEKPRLQLMLVRNRLVEVLP